MLYNKFFPPIEHFRRELNFLGRDPVVVQTVLPTKTCHFAGDDDPLEHTVLVLRYIGGVTPPHVTYVNRKSHKNTYNKDFDGPCQLALRSRLHYYYYGGVCAVP